MLERLFKMFLSFLLILFVAQMVLVALFQLLGQFGSPADGGAVLPNLLASMFWTVIVGAFGVGLLVRIHKWFRGRNAGSVGFREADERRARLAVREPAEDVPPHGALQALAHDPDPALYLEEGDGNV